MSELLFLALATVAGLALGSLFFGGLWWTVRKGILCRWSTFWFFGSMLLRMGVVLTGFYFVGRGDWKRLVACLSGFVIARFIVTRVTRTRIENPFSLAKDNRHAS